MKGYRIDPYSRTIEEVEHGGKLEDFYRLTDCECIDMVTINRHQDSMVLDDEGLIKRGIPLFGLRNFIHQLYAGKALVVGIDDMGENTAAPECTIEWLRDQVIWTNRTT